MNIKIFQIGFNKCGTLSIHNFLVENGIKSVHYLKGELANKIFNNHLNNLNLLSGLEQYDAFSDMESLTPDGFQYVANDLFKELHEAFPDAIFILNTRNVNDWIYSRLRHGGGTYLDRYRCILDKPKDQIIDVWKRQYVSHIKSVKDYFSNFSNANFIHLALDTCDSNQLGIFLTKCGFNLKTLNLPHIHKSPGKKISQKKQYLSVLLDAACFFQKEDPELSQSLFLNALKIDPTNVYALKMLTVKQDSLGQKIIKKLSDKL